MAGSVAVYYSVVLLCNGSWTFPEIIKREPYCYSHRRTAYALWFWLLLQTSWLDEPQRSVGADQPALIFFFLAFLVSLMSVCHRVNAVRVILLYPGACGPISEPAQTALLHKEKAR